MQFIKQDFMGIELDILTGHPEHDILFIATQVARAAGLKYPSQSVAAFKTSKACTRSLTIGELHEVYNKNIDLPNDMSGKTYQNMTSLLDEGATYQLLLRGHAPASEPFRKWVTEIVLPSIRKTGSFNVNEAQDDTSRQYAGELVLKTLTERHTNFQEDHPHARPSFLSHRSAIPAFFRRADRAGRQDSPPSGLFDFSKSEERPQAQGSRCCFPAPRENI